MRFEATSAARRDAIQGEVDAVVREARARLGAA
jgi:hypothetical protein